MSVQATAYVQRVRWESISEWAVMLALADCAGRDEWLCSEPQEAIAERAYVSKRTLIRVQRELQERGDIELVRRGGRDARGKITNIWRIVPRKGVTLAHGPEADRSSICHPVTPPTNGSGSGSGSIVGSAQFNREQDSNGTYAREGSVVVGGQFEPSFDSGAAAFAADSVGLLEGEVARTTGNKQNARDNQHKDVERVWAHYVEVMRKRKRELPKEESVLIREALKVATPDELCKAIDGCSKSAFHMGDNDRHKKYNQLAKIIKGRPRLNETTRDRIDYFLDLAEIGPIQPELSSVTGARVTQAKRKVVDGFELPGDEIAQAMAAEAEQWLAQQGITVKRSNDDRPTFE